MAAEFDNYRKRIDRERREQSEAAAEGVLLDLLPIVDDLERALQAPAAGDAQAYRAGVELIHRQMLDVLRRRGVTPIETAGVDFDPRLHQAVSQEQSDAHRDGRDHRGVPARLHAGRSPAAAGHGQGSGFVSKRDYYEVLGVTKTATDQEIKSAYRKLALKHHPDRNPGDKKAEDQFKEAAEAYAVLADTDKRHMYDRFGHAGLGGAATGGFDPNVFTGFEDILGGLGDVFGFGDIFGGGGRRRGPQRGADLRYDLEISFEESARGTETALQIPRQDTCETCRGSGAADGSKPTTCPQCKGRGQLRYQQGFFTVARTCGQCRGTGHGDRQALPHLSRGRARAEGAQAHGAHPRRDCHGTAHAADRRRRGRARRRPARRSLRRRARAGPRVLPPRRQRSLLRDAGALHHARARRGRGGADARRRRRRSPFPRALRPARPSG